MVKLLNPFKKVLELLLWMETFAHCIHMIKSILLFLVLSIRQYLKKKLFNSITSKKKFILKRKVLNNILGDAKKDFLLPKKN